jgi:hypothetical protein
MLYYKLKLLVRTDEGRETFKDFYCDATEIIGFYIPDDRKYDIVNLLFTNQVVSILQEKHITDYLYQTFISGCIEE